MSQQLLKAAVQELMGAAAEAACTVAYGVCGVDRVNSLYGPRTRPRDTRTGTIALDLPKLRHGTSYPD